MATTNGQKVALYLLLTSRSELRLSLEGKTSPHGVTSEGQPPTPAPDAATLAKHFVALANSRFNIAATDFNAGKLQGLFEAGAQDPSGGVTNVTNKAKFIRQALDMSGPYPDDNPCPGTGLQQSVFNAVAAAVPNI
jgi:hypothetical protein